MTNEEKIYNLLGIAKKASKIFIGTKLLDQIRQKNIFLVIITIDMGLTQRKRFVNKCTYYLVPYEIKFESLVVSKSIGKENVKAVGISDKNLANKILEYLK